MNVDRICLPAQHCAEPADALDWYLTERLKLDLQTTCVYASNLRAIVPLDRHVFRNLCANVFFQRRKIEAAVERMCDDDGAVAATSCRLFIYQIVPQQRALWVADVGEWTADFARSTFRAEDLQRSPSLDAQLMAVEVESEITDERMPVALYLPHANDAPQGGAVSLRRCAEICNGYYLMLSKEEPTVNPAGDTFWHVADVDDVTRQEDMFAVLFILASICKSHTRTRYFVDHFVDFHSRCLAADNTLFARMKAAHRYYANSPSPTALTSTLHAQMMLISKRYKENSATLPLFMTGFLQALDSKFID